MGPQLLTQVDVVCLMSEADLTLLITTVDLAELTTEVDLGWLYCGHSVSAEKIENLDSEFTFFPSMPYLSTMFRALEWTGSWQCEGCVV